MKYIFYVLAARLYKLIFIHKLMPELFQSDSDPYAFVEFADHVAASATLTALNQRLFLGKVSICPVVSFCSPSMVISMISAETTILLESSSESRWSFHQVIFKTRRELASLANLTAHEFTES
jgi:hypothetical protein